MRAPTRPSFTCCRRCGSVTAGRGRPASTGRRSGPTAESEGNAVNAVAEDESFGRLRLTAGPDPTGKPPTLLFCENETNGRYLYGDTAEHTPYPKDGINDHVVHGRATVNPAGHGTKMACWYRLTVAPGDTAELRLRITRHPTEDQADLGAGFEQMLAVRSREADEYYATLVPAGAGDDEAAVMRQAFAGIDLEPAVLSLRRRTLAQRRYGAAAGRSPVRP